MLQTVFPERSMQRRISIFSGMAGLVAVVTLILSGAGEPSPQPSLPPLPRPTGALPMLAPDGAAGGSAPLAVPLPAKPPVAVASLAPPPPAVPPAPPAARPPKDGNAGQDGKSPLHIEADSARYDRKSKIALATGNVLIRQEDMTITAEDAQYDENAKTSYVNDAVKVVQRDKKTGRKTTIDAFRLTAFHDEKRIVMEQDVRLDRAADPRPPKTTAKPKDKAEKRKRIEDALQRARTIITADEMEYWTRLKDASFVGNVHVTQPEKKASADRATMLEGPGTITLEGKAHLEQIKGDWIKATKVLDDGKKPDPELQKALANKAVIDADIIVMDQRRNDVNAQGNVTVTQKGRVVKADNAVFNDASGLITLAGNVRLQKENGDWLQADKAIVDTNRDRMEAIGLNRQVETQFTVDEDKVPDPVPKPKPVTPPASLPSRRP
jgi:lipopolysaccharide assembly outer membrane protein LptD (OstA)